MPDSLLTALKLIFLGLLYLFFFRVIRAVWVELREPKDVQVAVAPPRPRRLGLGLGRPGGPRPVAAGAAGLRPAWAGGSSGPSAWCCWHRRSARARCSNSVTN